MASLARLSSESVLQNVLPIFTFMGSNVFHRDDSYSFKVIQKVRGTDCFFLTTYWEWSTLDDRRYYTRCDSVREANIQRQAPTLQGYVTRWIKAVALHDFILLGTKDLMKTFTDAYTHVPRHRRTKYAPLYHFQEVLLMIYIHPSFFNHLVEVMGPADFLAPICMLLVDKTSNKVSRQDPKEASSILALPLALCEHHTPAIRVEVTAFNIYRFLFWAKHY